MPAPSVLCQERSAIMLGSVYYSGLGNELPTDSEGCFPLNHLGEKAAGPHIDRLRGLGFFSLEKKDFGETLLHLSVPKVG